jgi:thiamine-phosphate pyrophosphorylase
LLLGTLYATASHPDVAPAGSGLVLQVRGAVGLPLIGIGGITAANAGEVIRAGADGVAVVSAIQDAADVETAARQLVETVREASTIARHLA